MSLIFKPLLMAIIFGDDEDFNASNVALTILCGLELPTDFETTSCTPRVSKTALIGPPAIIPVPGGAVLKITFEAPCLPLIS